MLRSFDYGDRWKCLVCYTGNDSGDHCQECYCDRDGNPQETDLELALCRAEYLEDR